MKERYQEMGKKRHYYNEVKDRPNGELIKASEREIYSLPLRDLKTLLERRYLKMQKRRAALTIQRRWRQYVVGMRIRKQK